MDREITLHNIPARLFASEPFRREAFMPLAVRLANLHGGIDLNAVLRAMEAGFQFAVSGASEAERVMPCPASVTSPVSA